jgi:hypothetical protein
VNTYHLQGTIHPRRAQIQDHAFRAKFKHVSTGNTAAVRIRILVNELLGWVETPDTWDIFDLRNVIRFLTQTDLALVGFLTGHAYTVEIIRVTCETLGIDVVYGVDIACVASRNKDVPFPSAITKLRQLCVGENGAYIQRCMNDLLLAMQQPEDTAFFCYRAIESLKNHAVKSLPDTPQNPARQWDSFRGAADCTREEIDSIKRHADHQRHAADLLTTQEDRALLLSQTWKIVESYIKSLADLRSP